MYLFHLLNFLPVRINKNSMSVAKANLCTFAPEPNPLAYSSCCTREQTFISNTNVCTSKCSGCVIFLIFKPPCFKANFPSCYHHLFLIPCLAKLFQGQAYSSSNPTCPLFFLELTPFIIKMSCQGLQRITCRQSCSMS